MGFLAAGGQCCCCRDMVRIIEQGLVSEAAGTAGENKFRVVSPSKNVEFFGSPTFRPDQSNLYTPGVSCADWRHERVWGTYGAKVFSGSSWVDTNTVVLAWQAKKDGNAVVNEMFRLAGYVVEAIGASRDRLYYHARTHANRYLIGDVDWSTEFRSVRFDGTDDTLHATIPLYRASSGGGGFSGSGSILFLPQKRRLYYVKMQNVTTASSTDHVVNICYRDVDDMGTEVTIYEKTLAVGFEISTSFVRGLGCLSFDIERDKIYWVEMYRNSATINRAIGWVKRANLDGVGEETLYQSVDPYRVSFARYSNKVKKIVHCDSNRLPRGAGFLPGIWERNPEDWSDAKMVSLNGRVNDWGGSSGSASHFGTGCPVLWCGYETTGAASDM